MVTTPIVWHSDGRLFATSEGGKIKSFDTSTGSQIDEWEIHSHDSEDIMSVTLSADNRFIASSAGHSVSFWDTSTRTQLGNVLEDDDKIRSIALSPDGTRLATGGRYNQKITIWNLSDILPQSYLTFGSSLVRFSGPLGMVSLHMKINLIGVSSLMLSLLIPDLSR